MGGETPNCPHGNKGNAHAPLQFLAFFHRAIREELLSLRGLASTALEMGSPDLETVRELDRRFKFLELAQKYHSAAEDEVIFLALGDRVKNVICKYSREHKSIDGLFGSVFGCLNALMDGSDNIIKLFQELVICISTLWTSIEEHIVKEEQQIFPLFMDQFTSKEQASLVWQFVCSIPVIVLEDLLPWMISYFSPEEQIEVRHCMREIVPKNKLLQEVVISWLDKNPGSSSEVYSRSGNVDTDGPVNIKKIVGQCTFERNLGKIQKWKAVQSIQNDVEHHPLDILHHCHIAISKDLKEIMGELCQGANVSSFLNLGSLVVWLKFLADVLIYYSNALKSLFYPLSNELANSHFYSSGGQFSIDGRIESLQYLLHTKTNNNVPLSKFVEMLCQELKKFMKEVSKLFAFQENKVLPIICHICGHDTQLQLLYRSLHLMPLGLLKYAITWFSAHLAVDKSKSIVHTINQGDFSVHKAFSSILLEWFRIGSSGKISAENFTKDLQRMFKGTYSFLCEQIKGEVGSSSFHLYSCRESNSCLVEPLAVDKGKNSVSSLSSSFDIDHSYEMTYSSRIHLHIFFPGTLGILQPCMKSPSGMRSMPSVIKEPTPIDLIFIFHKALKKNLQYFVSVSAKLAENDGFLVDFRKNFHLTRYLYQLHTDAEDEIAFPALEAKIDLQNISHSYTIEHKLEVEHFNKVSLILDEISDWQDLNSDVDTSTFDKKMVKHHQLCLKLQQMCKSMLKLLTDHLHHEETELWPLFREHFSVEDQEKIIGCMLGRTRAEILRDLIPWLMASLTPEEQHTMMFLYRKITRNTMFDEWLAEWWEGYGAVKVTREANISPSSSKDPLEIISKYFSKVIDEEGCILCGEGFDSTQEDCFGAKTESFDGKKEEHDGHLSCYESSKCVKIFSEGKISKEVAYAVSQKEKPTQTFLRTQRSGHHDCFQTMSQYDLEAAVRRISRDTSLDPQEKSYLIQNLLTSRWIIRQQLSHPEHNRSSNREEPHGQFPSYRDFLRVIFGCQHYKRNCKLFTACCNQLYTCIRCHDELADHLVDRKSITRMMCMKCLIIQPIGPKCLTASCNGLSMARYYCQICKLFDDDRKIYHCPYCNLCRVGKGLGVDYFHCMKCNVCLSRSLSVHVCIEKCSEDNCPICHEYIFTSSSPVKALPCGHLMHSACFKDYTCISYTCPICCKSLGEMQVYFKMLDTLLAEEKIPEEYSGQTQAILCNDCGKKGKAPFHWIYHKCSYCGSYNTRLL